ncbi:Vitamin K epoxide reductase family protein [Catalinimonas alkaloidigena]|uniref:Vitamin K epoxide reductase family protein n=1 Tax=Catalinimonas alkaloidigena TaxID=1075417 RepID=A0A1G8ZVW5_9BACT|nr:vitamin K epoxide reductase family protein [Catalinimonas alkaloidigena]SDK19272.1 Vitamin K epoxide reductase family protein [Catalinimonas alkaloidigena]
MNLSALIHTLRHKQSPSLTRRRRLILLAAVGLVDFSLISLYQTGVIRRLPDLPGKLFDSNAVNASEEAYQFGVPDGPISAGVYALNMLLAAYKGDAAHGRPLWSDVALAGTVMLNSVGAALYLKNMITVQKKACLYCLTGAALNFVMTPLALAELRERLQNK